MMRPPSGAPTVGVLATAAGVLLVVAALSATEAHLVQGLLKDARVREALDAVRTGEARTIEDQVRFCETPAPPFRSTWYQ